MAMDRLALLNICLHLRQNKEVIRMGELSAENQNAFKAGRVFSLIVWAQSEAIGRDAGKTILAGNARLASTRPAAIIGYLVTRLQSIYLPKLRRDKPGMAVMIDREIGELLRESKLPAKNSPEQMGWFWKGFYHRDIENFKKSKEAEQ
jgi:CRISPR-associated protein Csd1